MTTREKSETHQLYADSNEVLGKAQEWLSKGHKVALATVVETWGSSPRPVGSQLAVDDQGSMLGSVSGGCIEGAVVMTAREVMSGGKPQMLDFGISDEMAWGVGLACGGKVLVYVEAIEP